MFCVCFVLTSCPLVLFRLLCGIALWSLYLDYAFFSASSKPSCSQRYVTSVWTTSLLLSLQTSLLPFTSLSYKCIAIKCSAAFMTCAFLPRTSTSLVIRLLRHCWYKVVNVCHRLAKVFSGCLEVEQVQIGKNQLLLNSVKTEGLWVLRSPISSDLPSLTLNGFTLPYSESMCIWAFSWSHGSCLSCWWQPWPGELSHNYILSIICTHSWIRRHCCWSHMP